MWAWRVALLMVSALLTTQCAGRISATDVRAAVREVRIDDLFCNEPPQNLAGKQPAIQEALVATGYITGPTFPGGLSSFTPLGQSAIDSKRWQQTARGCYIIPLARVEPSALSEFDLAANFVDVPSDVAVSDVATALVRLHSDYETSAVIASNHIVRFAPDGAFAMPLPAFVAQPNMVFRVYIDHRGGSAKIAQSITKDQVAACAASAREIRLTCVQRTIAENAAELGYPDGSAGVRR